MKFLFTHFVFLLSFISQAQVFSGSVGAIKNDSTLTNYNIQVTGLGTLNPNYGLVRVIVSISHPATNELHLFLRSQAASVALSVANGNGANYNGTIFENTAATSIRQGVPPFNGSYRPEQSLAVFNTNNLPGNGSWTLIVLDDNKYANAGTVTSVALEFGPNPAALTPVTKSNLPVFVVNTGGKPIVPIKDVIGSMYILNNPGGNNLISDTQNLKRIPIGIHIRGNSSVAGPKDPYSFSPIDIYGEDSNMSVLGLPSENDWILNNSYSDQSFMRDPISYYLSNKMGRYASRTRYCELFINGDYRGVYILMEKLKQDKNRVDISKLKITDTSGVAVTGGYILKKDGGTGVKDSGFVHPPSGYTYLYQDPDSLATQQKKYIKAYMDTVVNAVLNVPLFDTLVGYRKYIDYKSVIDYLIVCEFGVSGDTYNRSVYWHKDKVNKNNKFIFGPVWDFNYGFSNALTPLRFSSFTPWKKMYDDTFFKRELWCRYNEVRQQFFNTKTINRVMDSLVAPLTEAMYRNDERWLQNKIGAQLVSHLYYKDALYTLKKYTFERLRFMDSIMRGSCANLSGSCQPFLNYEVLNACSGDTATILVNTTASKVNISPATGVRKINNYKFLIAPSGSIAYRIVWSTCSFTDSVAIDISSNTKSTLQCSGKDTISMGDTILLVASGANSYSWNPSVMQSNATGDSVYVSPFSTTNYFVTGYSGIGCNTTITKRVFVKPAHEIIMYTSSDSLCSGAILKLKATGANEYIWDINDLLTITDSMTLYPTTNVVIKLTGLINGNPVDFKTKTVIVFPKKKLTVTPQLPVYNGTVPVMVTVKGGKTYSWTPATGLNRYDNDTVFASPSASTTYTINAIDSNGCNTTSTSIIVTTKTGINSAGNSALLSIYPNPASSEFYIESGIENSFDIGVFNVIGQKVYSHTVHRGMNAIDAANWIPGLYFIQTAYGLYRLAIE